MLNPWSTSYSSPFTTNSSTKGHSFGGFFGRIGPNTYFNGIFLSGIILPFIILCMALFGRVLPESKNPGLFIYLFPFFAAILLIIYWMFTLSLVTRRLHDLNIPIRYVVLGHLLILFIGISAHFNQQNLLASLFLITIPGAINMLLSGALCLVRGSKSANNYGLPSRDAIFITPSLSEKHSLVLLIKIIILSSFFIIAIILDMTSSTDLQEDGRVPTSNNERYSVMKDTRGTQLISQSSHASLPAHYAKTREKQKNETIDSTTCKSVSSKLSAMWDARYEQKIISLQTSEELVLQGLQKLDDNNSTIDDVVSYQYRSVQRELQNIIDDNEYFLRERDGALLGYPSSTEIIEGVPVSALVTTEKNLILAEQEYLQSLMDAASYLKNTSGDISEKTRLLEIVADKKEQYAHTIRAYDDITKKATFWSKLSFSSRFF